MKTFRKIMKEYCVKEALICWLVFYMVLGMPAQIAMAEVVLDNTAAGSITVTALGGGITQDMTATNGAIGNFSDFDIAAGHTVTCDQGGAGNSALFRVTGNGTEIYGKFEADGTIFLIDQAGILFGNDAVINVNQLVASSLNIADQDFANGSPFSFTGGSLEGTGDVTNNGTINAELIALIGRIVENNGTLNAENYTILAAGDSVIISQSFDGAVSVEVSMPPQTPGDYDYKIEHNKGSIDAQHVILAAGDIWANAYINAYDEANSDAVASVTIDAMGDVTITDEVKADTDAEDGQDNATSTVTVTADNLTIEEGGRIEAYAYTYDGSGDATATVDIDASGDVYIEAEGSCDTVEAQAEALRGGDDNAPSGSAVASTSIDAGGSIDIIDAGVKAFASAKGTETGTSTADVHIFTTGENGGDIFVSTDSKVHAKATTRYNGVDTPAGMLSDADLEIQSAQDVVINGMVKSKANTQLCDDEDVEINMLGNTQADLTIKSAGDILINQSEDKSSPEAKVMAHSHGGEENTATILVDADGDVKVYDAEDEDDDCLREGAEIFAHANNGNTNNSRIDVIARGVDDEKEGNVLVEGQIRALSHSCDKDEETRLAYNAQIDVTAAGDVSLDNGAIVAEASDVTSDGTGYSALEHNATVNVTAGGDVDVNAEYDGEAYIYAGADDGTNNTATTTVTAGEDVVVNAYDDSYAGIEADAEDGSSTNTAAVTVDAGDDVLITAEYDSTAEIDADADDGATNSVTIKVTAGEDVELYAWDYSEALIDADADGTEGTENNTASVQVTAENGDVDVHAYDSDAEISATARHGANNTATVDVAAVGGDVCVTDSGGYGDTAKIESTARYGDNNTAETTVTATAATTTYTKEVDEGVFEEFTETEGGNVYVEAYNEGHAEIAAVAEYAHSYSGNGASTSAVKADEPYGNEGTNTATVTVLAIGENVVAEPDNDPCLPYDPCLPPAVQALSMYDEFEVYGGNVEVYADSGSNAAIQAQTSYGGTDTADVLVCADSDVSVEGYFGSEANIRAIAQYADVANTATVGVGARGDRGVLVAAGYGGAAFIEADAYADPCNYYFYYYPQATNTAETVVCTAGDVIVLDEGEVPRTAGILSEAFDGASNDAYTGVCADGDVMVVAGVSFEAVESGYIPEYGSGGHAMIRSEAGNRLQYATSSAEPSVALVEAIEVDPTSANAETVVVSKEGGVLVADVTGYGEGSSQIYAEAYGADENTANVGVSAGGDLFDDEDPAYYEMTEGVGVLVVGMGDYSKAEIHAFAHDGQENTADTVVCTPEDVVVIAEGERSLAKIKSCAEDGDINTATTRIYANDVFVDVPGLYRGNGIWAYAEGYEETLKPHVESEFWMAEYDGDFGTGEFVKTEEDGESGSSASVTIQDYSNATDCPDCPPCPDCGDEELLAPVAPLAQFEVPRVEGCPAVMLATAAELGIPSETLQVAIGNSQATNPNIQPCQACSTLISAANMLKNEGDMRMAAMVQAFNTLAPAGAPFTPELSASVATAFATAEEGSIYASAAEYIDAMVQYVAVLDTDLGSPVGDSVAYAMEKYGTQIVGSDNANLTAFVTARIETLSTFAQ